MPGDESKTLLALYQNQDGSFGYWVDFSELSRREIADVHLTMETIRHDILTKELKAFEEDMEDMDDDDLKKRRDLLDNS